MYSLGKSNQDILVILIVISYGKIFSIRQLTHYLNG